MAGYLETAKESLDRRQVEQRSLKEGLLAARKALLDQDALLGRVQALNGKLADISARQIAQVAHHAMPT